MDETYEVVQTWKYELQKIPIVYVSGGGTVACSTKTVSTVRNASNFNKWIWSSWWAWRLWEEPVPSWTHIRVQPAVTHHAKVRPKLSALVNAQREHRGFMAACWTKCDFPEMFPSGFKFREADHWIRFSLKTTRIIVTVKATENVWHFSATFKNMSLCQDWTL